MQCGAPCRATKAETRRRNLIDVARRLFTERGFHATGVAQIAAASGVRVGQIYRDFQSKEDIIAAIVAADLAEFLDEAELDAAVTTGDAAAAQAWIGRFLRIDGPADECRMMLEILAEAARNERIAEIHRGIDRRITDLLVRALTALHPDPAGADARRALADLIMTLGTGLINRRITDPDLDLSRLEGRLAGIVDREIGALVTAGEPVPAVALGSV